MLEDRILTAKAEHEATGRDFRVGPLSFLGFLNHLFWLRIKGRLRRFGTASVSFGEPVSLAAWEQSHGTRFRKLDKEELFASVEVLGRDLMAAVGKIVPALPVSVLCHALLEHGDDWVSEAELIAAVLGLMRQVEAEGGHVDIPEDERHAAVGEGLALLALRHLVEADASAAAAPIPASDCCCATTPTQSRICWDELATALSGRCNF